MKVRVQKGIGVLGAFLTSDDTKKEVSEDLSPRAKNTFLAPLIPSEYGQMICEEAWPNFLSQVHEPSLNEIAI